MKANDETLRKIAHLSRLEFSEANGAAMLNSLNRMLDWVEKLNELDTSQVEPLIHMTEAVNVLREDEAQPPMPHDQALRNAPKKDSDYFRVPKVME